MCIQRHRDESGTFRVCEYRDCGLCCILSLASQTSRKFGRYEKSQNYSRGSTENCSTFANVIHLDTHASKDPSATIDSYDLARNIAHELNPLQVLITMLTCPLPRVASSEISIQNGNKSERANAFECLNVLWEVCCVVVTCTREASGCISGENDTVLFV